MEIEKLIQIGGSEWKKDDKHRIYFNDLPGLYGLEFSTYKTGNISSATLDGHSVSNSQARKILGSMGGSKLWYDVEDGQFHSQYLSDTTFHKIVAEITRRAI